MKKIFLILLIAITSLFINAQDQEYLNYSGYPHPNYSGQQGALQERLDQCKSDLQGAQDYAQLMKNRYERTSAAYGGRR